MKTYLIILQLLYKSSNWLLKFSFFALPLSLFLSISTYLFIENILQSYQHYLVKSYIGVQGRLSIESQNIDYMKDLEQFSKKNHYIYSLKQEVKANVIFLVHDKKVVKYAKFIILTPKYLQQKLHTKLQTNELFVNKTFAQSMGSFGIDNLKTIQNEENNITLPIKKVTLVDTGFLGNVPIVYITQTFAKKLFPTLPLQKYSIEFLETKKEHIEKIKQIADKLAAKHHVLAYTIYDILIDTKETREFFKKIYLIEKVILSFLAFLSFGVILLAIIISIEFKRNSLYTLSLLGMSGRDLSITIATTVFSLIIISFIISIFALDFYREIFLNLSSFHRSFFLPIQIKEYIILLGGGFLLSVILFFITKYSFQKG